MISFSIYEETGGWADGCRKYKLNLPRLKRKKNIILEIHFQNLQCLQKEERDTALGCRKHLL